MPRYVMFRYCSSGQIRSSYVKLHEVRLVQVRLG